MSDTGGAPELVPAPLPCLMNMLAEELRDFARPVFPNHEED
jgi:hypothetical protein